jgi:thiamine biosynthesis lipoprotein
MTAPSSTRQPRLGRRRVLGLIGSTFVVALVPPALRRRALVTRSIPVMGTIARVMIAHRDRAAAEAAIDLAFDRLRQVDRAMSRHQPESEVGRANRFAARDAVRVGPQTARVLARALEWADRTDGEFDPALARVMEVWDPGRRRRPPPAEEFERLAGRRLHRGITLDRWRGDFVVRFDNPDVGIDLGGIAKGYAVDEAVDALRAAGIRDAVVGAGGDLRAIGRSADGACWRIGIRSPTNPAAITTELEVEGGAAGAVATSGDYFQGFDYQGRRYHHIMDAARGEPRVVASHSLTVQAATCLDADAAATAGFGLGAADARRLIERCAVAARVIAL